MNQEQPFLPDPNAAVDEITGFLREYSISSPSRQVLVFGASYGSSPPATDHSRARVPLLAHPPLTPTTRHRTYTATSASTSPSMTFDVGSYPSSSYTAQSYADSMPTTAPSLGSTVLPGNSEYILPCEFVGYESCDQYFYPIDADQWMNHIIVDHLQERLPNKSNCWFCDNQDFDARRDHTDKASSFRNRLDHIRIHIRDERLGIRNMRPDYDFVAHLWKHGLIRRRVYEAAQRWREGPSHVEGIVPHDFIPEEQIQREKLSQRVVVSEPRERERSHRSHRHHHKSREDTGHHHKSREDTGHHHKSRKSKVEH